MLSGIKNIIKNKWNILQEFHLKIYSQEGEDAILRRIFENKKTGFYIDVGAHHPFRFSNTYYFYKMGWRGINIDASPTAVKLLQKYRVNDINLNYLVSSNSTEKNIFYIFNDEALNTASDDRKNQVLQAGYKVVKEINVFSESLENILEKNLKPLSQPIDFMSIDVEGFDFDVLKSNNWQKFRPDYLLVEVSGAKNINAILGGQESLFLKEKGYNLFAKTVNSVIYKKEL